MLKPQHVTPQRLHKLLTRAFYSATLHTNGPLSVMDGLPCVVNITVETERKFIRLQAWYSIAHLDEGEIVAAANRLNDQFFLVKFIGGKDTITMAYALPFAEGLVPKTFVGLLRRFAAITAEAFQTLPKPLADAPPVAKSEPKRLH